MHPITPPWEAKFSELIVFQPNMPSSDHIVIKRTILEEIYETSATCNNTIWLYECSLIGEWTHQIK